MKKKKTKNNVNDYFLCLGFYIKQFLSDVFMSCNGEVSGIEVLMT